MDYLALRPKNRYHFRTMILTVLLFIAILSVLVFVHELGHFLMARACGMKVEEFGFGFPPRAFGVKKGDTLYSINWIPIGGFVKIKGENGNDRKDPDSFSSKTAWQRFLVLIAGVVMNFLLAIVLLSIGFMVGLPTVIESKLPDQAHLAKDHLSVMQVLPGSPAAKAGVVTGDAIASIDGNVIVNAEDARTYLGVHGTSGMDLVLQKDDSSTRTVHVTSEPLAGQGVTGIGIAFARTALVSYPFYLAIPQGIFATWQFTVEILQSFWSLLKNLVVAHSVSADLSGPVGIAVMTGQVAAMGLVYVLQFAAILSINLGVVNALPFPALDGGRILFIFIEKVRGKSTNERLEVIAHNLGFLFLMALVVFVTVKDVIHLFK